MWGTRKKKAAKKRKPVGSKPISWPLESHRDATSEGKQAAGATLRRISISWPLDSTTVPASVPLYPHAHDDHIPRTDALAARTDGNIDGDDDDANTIGGDTSFPSALCCTITAATASDKEDSLSVRPKTRSMSVASTKRGMSLASILREGKPGICSIDEGGYSNDFNFDSPSKLPSAKAWELAADVPLFDSDGNSRTFRSIYAGAEAVGEQQLVIFVRHFFCGACQAYLKELSRSINLKKYFALPVPTSITIIGFGSPFLLPVYRKVTGTNFAIFTDPTRKLYRLLGMSWTLNMGHKTEYYQENEAKWVLSQLKEMKKEPREVRFRGGAWWWVGGEFLIREGRVIWCHRMKNYRDHIELDVIKRIVGADI